MYDLAILGGGPSGLTAGMYAGRANLKTIVVDKGLPGGQMQNTLEIENYPGYKSITGPQLSELYYEHMLEFGAEWRQAEVVDVDLAGSVKKIILAGGETITAKALIIATGTQPKKLNVPGERELAGRGVSYCATCDGAFFRNKHVIVVGGGDSAVEEGIFLTRFAAQVTIVHRRDQLRAAPILQQRAFANDKIRFVWDTIVEEIVGENRVTQVKLKNMKTGEVSHLDADGVFIYIGYLPNTGFLQATGLLNANGYIDTDGTMATKIPGVFAAGDVRETYLRQIVTAAGDGAVAAMSAYHYLETL
ncbi:MAG: thioredoxin-disulfide reductase [Firmicutes bacterium]|jgi:thioredoxin reductase (NADPH)|nr:thioredoxin-disulfide reductase [Bacillota bacterium]